ncbi:hypothetical protein ACIRPK_27720 [Kitasatospora sp. NPDC101801]|uniref:hypothetical protein n=1 Tax=Kitasatospora sp. NPDC101801 TaxID=3364103 RepID=UPI0037F5B8C3
MLSDSLHAIASEAGFAVVQTAGTDLWPAFHHQLASWIAREDRQVERSALAHLSETAAALRTADEADVWSVSARHTVAWQDRFVTLLERLEATERDSAASQLQFLIRGHSTGAPREAGTAGAVTSQNLRLQAGDNSLVAAVVNGDVRLVFRHAPDLPQG